MLDEQRTDEQSADRIGGRPIRRIVVREPSFPHRQELWGEVAPVPGKDLDAKTFHFQMSIGHEPIREGEPVVHCPPRQIIANNLASHLSNGLRPDIKEADVIDAPKIPAGIERPRRS